MLIVEIVIKRGSWDLYKASIALLTILLASHHWAEQPPLREQPPPREQPPLREWVITVDGIDSLNV